MRILMLVYPDMTLLDLVGPLQTWQAWPDASIELVSATQDPVPTDTQATILPTHSYRTAAADPDILFVPGGTRGSLMTMSDERTLDFLQDRGGRARWVTSVCTGALLLGAAGLLTGYRATTHWAVLPTLAEFGAIPVSERWVIDRDRATGGGVTAGIDFGLALMAKIAGEPIARVAQLTLEYTPRPPFQSGTPDEANQETLDAVERDIDRFRRAVSSVANTRSHVSH